MSIIGLSCVMLVYLFSLLVSVIKPEIASHIVSLSTLVITFMGSLVGAYTIGQSFVDWKTSGTIENLSINETQKSDMNADLKIIEHYAGKYKDDESYAPLTYTEIN